METLIMRKFCALVLALGLAACANDSTAPSTSVDGTYNLRTVNGTTLPYTFSNGLQLVSEQVIMTQDGSFTDRSQYSNGQTSVDTGFWTSLNGSITFTDNTAGVTYSGSVSGTVLTVILNNFTETFQKQ